MIPEPTPEQALCYSTLSSQALRFGKANAVIVRQCGHDAGMLLNALIDLHLNDHEEDGVAAPIEVLSQMTCLTKYKQANAFKELSKLGVITVTTHGSLKRRQVTLHFDKILAVLMGNFSPVLHSEFSPNDDEETSHEKKRTSPCYQGFPGSGVRFPCQDEFILTRYPELSEDETLYLQGIQTFDGEFDLTRFREFLLIGAAEYCRTTKREIDTFGVENHLSLIQLFLAGYHGRQHKIAYPIRWLSQTTPFDTNGHFNQATENGYDDIIRLSAWYAGQLSEADVAIVHNELLAVKCENMYYGLLKPAVCEKLHTLKTYWETHHGCNGEEVAAKDAAA